MDREIKNAVIKSVFLGYEDHGILACGVTLDYGNFCQEFGGYVFDEYNKETGTRHGTSFGMEFIAQLLQELEVDKWEGLVGATCRADADHRKVYGLGHLLKDKWMYPEKYIKRMENENL